VRHTLRVDLNVAMVVASTEAEGPGKRFAIWVQGCPYRCVGCCNPEMLAFGKVRDQMSPQSLAAQALAAGVEGVSFLGGEPFSQAAGLAEVARLVRAGGLSVMVYSGHTLEEIRALEDPGAAALLSQVDLLVDGRYDETRRSTGRRWIGSDNQVLHFLTDRYAPDDPRFKEPNTVEIRMRKGVIELNGWPVLGNKTRL
jgi:anaerobic ribonucleoside-triphosphate reductase activating protein